MDSQLTLVGRPAHSHTVLVFDGESIFDARVLRLGQSTAIYTVASTPDGCRTTVRDAQGHIAAALRFRTILPDRVSVRDGPEVTVNLWLKGRRECSASFGAGQAQYLWKLGRTHRLLLFLADGPEAKPIAWFERANPAAGTPARLSLTADAEIILDQVMVSLLVLEHDAQDQPGEIYAAREAGPSGIPVLHLQLRF